MKYKKIIKLIETAGFKYVGEKPGTDLTEGKKIRNYQTPGIGGVKERQIIHLVINDRNEEDFFPMFSLSVPQKLRDDVYAMMNVPSDELQQQNQFQNPCIS